MQNCVQFSLRRKGEMSSHDGKEPVERIGFLASKRISTLNEHEDHILRRRINAYQKIHSKEIAGVASKLDEIRESMKALATDPLYGTHALIDAESSDSVRSPRNPATNGQKSKLRRTQSFPEVLEGSNISSASTLVFPALKGEHQVSRHLAKLGERTVFNDTVKSRTLSTSSPKIHDGVQLRRETSDLREMGHKKLERSKTAPVAMLQPLLKTTPEMMRKKIHISTSNRHSNDETATRRGPSPRVGDASSRMHSLQTQGYPGQVVRRPKSTPDSNFKLVPSRAPSHDPRRPSKFPAKRVATREEPNDDMFASLHGKNAHGSKSAIKSIVGLPQKFHDDVFETNELSDKEQELKYCQYLRFSKENQESNRI